MCICYLIGMTDMSYSIGYTFAEIFIRVIVKKFNLGYIVRVLAGQCWGTFWMLSEAGISASCSGFKLHAPLHCCPNGVDGYGFCGVG